MSIPVDLDALRDQLAQRRRPAYVITAGDAGPPHLVATYLRWADGAFEAPAGRHTARNVGERPHASVVVPPDEAGGYSLIFDADAAVDGEVVRLAPTTAVLHRPAEGEGEPGSCGHDCAPVTSASDPA
jgi:hypothetical protein